ncbi:diguanylate cyclase (GGDEF)-like protein [Hungatella effluvii]|uniref:Diguanylate cyclase (GGDEF)-like protein n=2 Tax=Hungatella effluvii TaxID=1096246 RepID=A0A2V3XY37_9FIRM|nr:diguanylate cyclase (GGDEF)-like protein [Hungatella effluvii]
MDVYDNFIKESERIMQNTFQPGRYYVLYINIADICILSRNYGGEAADVILHEMEELCLKEPDILLCSRISEKLILCLCYLVEEGPLEDFLKHCDDELQAFLVKQREKYLNCGLKAVCGIGRIENSHLLKSGDAADAADADGASDESQRGPEKQSTYLQMEEQSLNRMLPHGDLLAHTRFYLFMIVLCAVFLGVCITGVLTISRRQTQKEFTAMVLETLNAYTDGQRENTLKEIDGVTSTLQSLAILIRKNNKRDFINAYLQTLNEDSPEVEYMYSTLEEYWKLHQEGRRLEHDTAIIGRMEQGEIVVTDITYSERLGNIYCIEIGVPVVKDGELIGIVRGIINAATLVKTELYDPAQGELAAVFLTDDVSTILPTQTADGVGVGQRLLDRLENYGIDGETLETLEAAFRSDESRAESVRVGAFDGYPYYLSVTGLKYNGWHLVVCLKADRALEHYQYIIHGTAYSIAGLLTAVLAASAVLLILGRKMQQRFSMDERRYLLLERFSDTVLFDYDCCHDTIRFTSNVTKFLRVHELVQADFLKHLNQVYIHEADQDLVRQMLKGRLDGDPGANDLGISAPVGSPSEGSPPGEIKVRLMRPEADEYFWCLAQYQYLYEKGTLVSIIGKITDIDEQMKHEDLLLKISETDGLTGLLNKAAAENVVCSRLEKVQKAMLFIMDVDDFKEINDQYGHDAGDRALQFLGKCMRLAFSEQDILGRIGGDEMLVFSENIGSREEAVKISAQLNRYLADGGKDGIPGFHVSFGAAQYPEDGSCFQELFHAADQSMYTQKKRAKSRQDTDTSVKSGGAI